MWDMRMGSYILWYYLYKLLRAKIPLYFNINNIIILYNIYTNATGRHWIRVSFDRARLLYYSVYCYDLSFHRTCDLLRTCMLIRCLFTFYVFLRWWYMLRTAAQTDGGWRQKNSELDLEISYENPTIFYSNTVQIRFQCGIIFSLVSGSRITPPFIMYTL